MTFFPPSVARRAPALQLGYVIAIFVACLAAFMLTIAAGATVFGCAAAGPACKVIDLAKEACTIFRYTDPTTGETREVRVTPADAAAFARHVEATRAGTSASAAPPPAPAGSR